MSESAAVENRREALYTFLVMRGDIWTPMIDVYFGLRLLYPRWESGSFHNSVARREITRDIQSINYDPEYEKIIIAGNRGVKIATRDEAVHFIGNKLRSIFQELERANILKKKAGLDGQRRFFANDIEAFIKESNNG